jgi:hypothetical protein
MGFQLVRLCAKIARVYAQRFAKPCYPARIHGCYTGAMLSVFFGEREAKLKGMYAFTRGACCMVF